MTIHAYSAVRKKVGKDQHNDVLTLAYSTAADYLLLTFTSKSSW